MARWLLLLREKKKDSRGSNRLVKKLRRMRKLTLSTWKITGKVGSWRALRGQKKYFPNAIEERRIRKGRGGATMIFGKGGWRRTFLRVKNHHPPIGKKGT